MEDIPLKETKMVAGQHHKIRYLPGRLVAQWVKHLTQGFASGCDFRVMRLSSESSSALSIESPKVSLATPPASPPSCTHFRSLINKS